ncbi:MAG: hypothetical protein QNI85_00255, partial [Desulfobacterales bacterium]|nr:hypothetical protein [Desulfobacterales bacterium]
SRHHRKISRFHRSRRAKRQIDLNLLFIFGHTPSVQDYAFACIHGILTDMPLDMAALFALKTGHACTEICADMSISLSLRQADALVMG